MSQGTDLTGKVALVTGSTTGLGLAIAKELANRGAKVALNYAHNRERAEAACSTLMDAGGQAALFQADVTDEESVNQLIADIKVQWDPVDILVPNATADQPVKPIEDYTWSDYETMLSFFVKSPFLLTQAVVADMKDSGWGRIVNIGSEVVEEASANFSAYVAAKGAQKAWSQGMARELAPFGITVNIVSPGWIPTDRHRGEAGAGLDAYLKTIPVSRLGIPDDVAQAVANFCLPASSFLTGQILCVNGGRTLS